MLEMAQFLVRKGKHVVPLREDEKTPAILHPFAFQPNAVTLRYWFVNRRANLGLVLNGLAILDCDTPEAEDDLTGLGIDSSLVVESAVRKMKHRYFAVLEGMNLKNWQNLNGVKGLDVKTGEHAYSIFPPSQVKGGEYRFLTDFPPKSLPLFPEKLIPKPKNCKQRSVDCNTPDSERLRRARLGLQKIYSIEGSGGDMGLWKAACWCCQTMKLNKEEALALLRAWNADGEHCLPPWEDGRLAHKVRDAMRLRR